MVIFGPFAAKLPYSLSDLFPSKALNVSSVPNNSSPEFIIFIFSGIYDIFSKFSPVELALSQPVRSASKPGLYYNWSYP